MIPAFKRMDYINRANQVKTINLKGTRFTQEKVQDSRNKAQALKFSVSEKIQAFRILGP
jgi:hypothetical protein